MTPHTAELLVVTGALLDDPLLSTYLTRIIDERESTIRRDKVVAVCLCSTRVLLHTVLCSQVTSFPSLRKLYEARCLERGLSSRNKKRSRAAGARVASEREYTSTRVASNGIRFYVNDLLYILWEYARGAGDF